MKYLEMILLILSYTILVITLFFEVICYQKKLEKLTTIAFTSSLLLLIIAFTTSSFLQNDYINETTPIFTLFSMILVAITTPLNVMEERAHQFSSYWKNALVGIAFFLMLIILLGDLLIPLYYAQYIVMFFLSISIVLSMSLVRMTKPKKNMAYREKLERQFAVVFMIVIPLTLFLSYYFTTESETLKIGLLVPIVFILLSGEKLLDDLNRLSLVKTDIQPIEQHFKNYTISNREKEVAVLLIKGKTYKQISEELFISIPTVKTHSSNIYKKCGVKNRSALTALLMN